MPVYKTRHLEAVRDVELGRDIYPAGQKFMATEGDADYLIRAGRAKAVQQQEEKAAAKPAAKPVQAPVAAKPAAPQQVSQQPAPSGARTAQVNPAPVNTPQANQPMAVTTQTVAGAESGGTAQSGLRGTPPAASSEK